MSGAFGCLLLGEECEATRLGDAAQVRGKEAAGERSNSRRLAGQSLVHWVLRRASEAQQLRGLVVSARPEHASTAFLQALPGNVCLHVSDAPDAWTRLLDCQQWLEKHRRYKTVQPSGRNHSTRCESDRRRPNAKYSGW